MCIRDRSRTGLSKGSSIIQSAIKNQRFKKIMKGESQDIYRQYDSDEDIDEKDLGVGDQIDLLDQHSYKQVWVTGKIEENIGDLIYVKVVKTNHKHLRGVWLCKDSERLAPFNTMQQYAGGETNREADQSDASSNSQSDKEDLNDRETDNGGSSSLRFNDSVGSNREIPEE
eukprot:TRINITY_DN8557_c0_g1_i1.p1 TRINITY_DN8557_c0_g1~~TRINITY_DN8557_c0_g1_i1.p1  ORF type:complete len:196 (+),score=15.64 TRINITY_DN8557_c0_g1_i1:77-589(+)